MKYIKTLSDQDHELSASILSAFVPGEIYDIHTHPYHPLHFPRYTMSPTSYYPMFFPDLVRGYKQTK